MVTGIRAELFPTMRARIRAMSHPRIGMSKASIHVSQKDAMRANENAIAAKGARRRLVLLILKSDHLPSLWASISRKSSLSSGILLTYLLISFRIISNEDWLTGQLSQQKIVIGFVLFCHIAILIFEAKVKAEICQ